jgi:hypothetical protein
MSRGFSARPLHRRLSPMGHHIVATTSGHWIQFDDPDIVVSTIRQMIDGIRRTQAA